MSWGSFAGWGRSRQLQLPSLWYGCAKLSKPWAAAQLTPSGQRGLGNIKSTAAPLHTPVAPLKLTACITLLVLTDIVIFAERNVPRRLRWISNQPVIRSQTPISSRLTYLQSNRISGFAETLTSLHIGAVLLFLCVSLHMLLAAHGLFSFSFSSATAVSFKTPLAEPREGEPAANRAIKLRQTIAQSKQAGKMWEKKKKRCFSFDLSLLIIAIF